MGKASSTKKVARAARAGGRVSSGQPRGLLFPGVLVLIVALGVSLVVYARNDRSSQEKGAVPQLGDHIHQAIAVNICGEFQPDIPEFESSVGIHTHGDGVLHIHPFSELGVGPNATLGRFLQDAREGGKLDVKISGSKLNYSGATYEEGKAKCEGVDRPQLRVAYWKNVGDEASKPVVTTGAFNDLRLDTNGGGFTIYYGDPKAEIPKPPSGSNLAQLGAADGGQTPDTQGNTTTTAAPGDTGSTSTTAPSGETTTTAAN
ncbi:MAG: hypothetical protein ACT4OV_03990 [Microthrixaceae bacterium]